VVVGDTGETESILEYCRDADGLVIEGTYLQPEEEMAREFSHLTAKDAAELAIAANVKQLFITHISRRYRDKDVEKEAQAIFPSAVVVHDFDISWFVTNNRIWQAKPVQFDRLSNL
jgi:ribonuclease Z